MKLRTLLKGAQSMVEKIFIPASEMEEELECSIDDESVECEKLEEELYVGVPAPAYLEDDPWFGPAPVRSEKQLDYMEQETIIKQEEEEKRKEYSGEPCNMHQLMYEMATSNWNTVEETQGGSENFQEVPGGWQSGNGWSVFKQ